MPLTLPSLIARAEVMDAIERTTAVASWAWVHQMDRLAELIGGTASAWQKGLPSEVACALSIGERVASGMLDTAWELRGRPQVRAAVLANRLNPRQAEVVLDELTCVDPIVADQILDVLLAGSASIERRPEPLRTWLNKRTTAADPDGAKSKRVLAEREETGVRYRSLRNGLAQKITTGPVVDIQKAMRQLDAMTPPVSSEVDRTRGQLLFDTELGAIAQAAAPVGVGPVPVELELLLPVKADSYALTPVTKLPQPVTIRLDLEALADILAGTGQEGLLGPGAAARTAPAVPGDTDIDADSSDTADAPALRPALRPAVRSRACARLDALERARPSRANRKGGCPEHRLTQLIARRGRPPLEVLGHQRGDEPGGCLGPTSSGPTPDPSTPARPISASSVPARPIPTSSVPMLAGHGPIDPDLVRRHLGEASIRRVLIDPVTGVCAVDPKPIGLNEIVTAPIPQPPPATKSYTPTEAIKRVVRARNPTCTFPGCRHRADKADLDHAVAFDQGGETTVANLHPACRHHHQVKQRGWTVTRTPDGSSIWTSPLGRRYRSTPGEH